MLKTDFFVTEQCSICYGFGKPFDHRAVFMVESCVGLVAAVRHNVDCGGSLKLMW
jgi:hypothetical protein